MACRSRLMREPSRSIGAALLRTSPPPCPSVVEDASSNCSLHEPAQQELMPGAGSAMAHQARDLGLVHRIDHGGRCAGAAERVANVDDVGDAGAFAAEFARHRDAEKPLGARGGDRLFRKSRIAIDRGGSDLPRPRRPFAARSIKSAAPAARSLLAADRIPRVALRAA